MMRVTGCRCPGRGAERGRQHRPPARSRAPARLRADRASRAPCRSSAKLATSSVTAAHGSKRSSIALYCQPRGAHGQAPGARGHGGGGGEYPAVHGVASRALLQRTGRCGRHAATGWGRAVSRWWRDCAAPITSRTVAGAPASPVFEELVDAALVDAADQALQRSRAAQHDPAGIGVHSARAWRGSRRRPFRYDLVETMTSTRLRASRSRASRPLLAHSTRQASLRSTSSRRS